MVHADRDAQRCAIVHDVVERAVADAVDDAAHAFLGVVHDVAHVGGDCVPAVLRNHAPEFLHAFSLAATWALMSATFTSGLRAG